MATTDPRYLVEFTVGNPTTSALNGMGDADATLKLAGTHWLATAARGDLHYNFLPAQPLGAHYML